MFHNFSSILNSKKTCQGCLDSRKMLVTWKGEHNSFQEVSKKQKESEEGMAKERSSKRMFEPMSS